MAERIEAGGRSMTLIDLSNLLTNATADHEPNPHRIEYVDHRTSAAGSRAFGVDPDLWPDGEAWAVEQVTLSTHAGTHVDAPYHYGRLSAGAAALTVDRIPLRWCFGDAFVLDMTHKVAGEGIVADDVERELARIHYAVKPYDIALMRTDTWKGFREPGYDQRHPGLRRSATEWLVDHGVKLIGIDAWGLDRPFDVMVGEAEAGDRDQLWESHFLGTEKPYCQIEKLCHLDELPRPHGFQVCAFPVLLEGASAAWSRVVAVIED